MDGQYLQLIENGEQSLAIAIGMGIPSAYEYGILSEAYLLNERHDEALMHAREAQKFDQPRNNHNVSSLLGIILLRQGEMSAVRESHAAFTRAIAQADEILAKTPDYYEALDAKG